MAQCSNSRLKLRPPFPQSPGMAGAQTMAALHAVMQHSEPPAVEEAKRDVEAASLRAERAAMHAEDMRGQAARQKRKRDVAEANFNESVGVYDRMAGMYDRMADSAEQLKRMRQS